MFASAQAQAQEENEKLAATSRQSGLTAIDAEDEGEEEDATGVDENDIEVVMSQVSFYFPNHSTHFLTQQLV